MIKVFHFKSLNFARCLGFQLIRESWKRAVKDAELEDFRFHDLRHTTASYLAQSGATLLEIADVLGHKQIEVTKRYAHLCIEHKSSLINRVMGSI
mgnify:CR=1 FL=1